MKKIIFFILGVCIAGIAVAVVVNIDLKNDGDEVSAIEFNQILDVLSGVYNDNGSIGIGEAPASGVKLDVDGILRIQPETKGDCTPALMGSIVFDQSDKHLYGCANQTWLRFDEPEDCDELISDYCTLPLTPSGNTGMGTCEYGGSSCSSFCANGNWGTITDNCTAPASCINNLISSCNVTATGSGGANGTCASGYEGDCSYTCTNGTWGSPSTNDCTAPVSCDELTSDYCTLPSTTGGNTVGTCEYGGSCSGLCGNGTWVSITNNCTAPACTENSQCVDGNVCTSDVCSSGTCSNPNEESGYDTGLCRQCDGSGAEIADMDDSDCGTTISCDDYHHISGTASTTGTNYCYDSPDMTTNRCKSLGVCKTANTADCGSEEDTQENACGTCKYVGGCSGTTDGFCFTYSNGMSCGGENTCVNGVCTCIPNCTGKECGSNGCGDNCGTCATNKPCINNHCGCTQNSDCPDGASECGWCNHSNECSTCFVGKEEVSTPSGPVAIEDIQVGDVVVSYDDVANEFTTSTVGEVIIHDGVHENITDYSRDHLLEVVISIGEGEVRTEVTDNHLYFNPEQQIYKPIGTFERGDSVLSIEGEGILKSKTVLIDGNSSVRKQQTIVYNLHMSTGPSNYLVDGVVVHNSKEDWPDCD